MKLPAAAAALALCLLVSGAAAQPAPSCSVGWQPMEEALLADLASSVTPDLVALANATDYLLCDAEPATSSRGCQQASVGATRHVSYINVTCPDTEGREVTITLQVDALSAAAGTGSPTVTDLDVEGVYVDGVWAGSDLDDLFPDTDPRDQALDLFEEQLEQLFDTPDMGGDDDGEWDGEDNDK